MKRRVHVLIRGRVQGVFFRDATSEEAARHHVTGWVRNLPDGRVEAVFEGDAEDVEALIAFCHCGPQAAKVTGVGGGGDVFRGLYEVFGAALRRRGPDHRSDKTDFTAL